MTFVISESQSLGVLPGTKMEMVKQIEKMSRDRNYTDLKNEEHNNLNLSLMICKGETLFLQR